MQTIRAVSISTSSCGMFLAASSSWTRLMSCFSLRVVGVDVIYKTTFPIATQASGVVRAVESHLTLSSVQSEGH